MYPATEPDPPVRQIVRAIRANAAPLALAAALLLAARISRIATHDPEVTGLTAAALAEVALVIAAHALATLTGCWTVLTGGQPAGFAALRALPPRRLGPFAVYALVFNLWFLALSAILTRAAVVLAADGATAALAVGLITAVTLVLMYVQLGFLFPDVVQTGETSIIFSMALGFSSARRVVAVLALPVAALILPHAVLETLLFDPPGMARAAAGVPSLDLAAAAVLAVLGAAGAMACAVAMSRLYLDLTQRLPGSVWR